MTGEGTVPTPSSGQRRRAERHGRADEFRRAQREMRSISGTSGFKHFDIRPRSSEEVMIIIFRPAWRRATNIERTFFRGTAERYDGMVPYICGRIEKRTFKPGSKYRFFVL